MNNEIKVKVMDGYDINRVNKVNIGITWCVVMAMIIQTFITEPINIAISNAINAMPVAIFATVLYFIPIKRFIKSLLFGLIPVTAITALFALNGFALDFHYVYCLSAVMIALYFNSKLVIIFGIVVDIAMLFLYFTNHANFLGSNDSIATIVCIFISYNAITVALYFLTKWGNGLIDASNSKREEADLLLKKIQESFVQIDKGTDILNENINSVNNNLKATTQSSSKVINAMNEMSLAITDEASSIYETNEKMSDSIALVNETREYATILSEKSNSMEQMVIEGNTKINEISKQNSIISSSVGSALTTVTELQQSMKEVNEALNEISEITEQINLLSLNAAIEAARAGEYGRGFAVVSEEVRKLADKSRGTADKISTIVSDVTSKSMETLQMVSLGDNSVKQGEKMLQDVNEYFEQMKSAIIDTNKFILKSIQGTNQVAEKFIDIQKRVENVASISEENSASIEEVLSTVEEENNEIIEISKSMENISHLSAELKKMIV
ncbi:hypothetical protein EHE19_018885 [Ruminiclostridium herbifermentans]|uniref:Uncharacterized protein n=1 Tax=Ruminiclostridium herbifermentans TaxID=2488810 RepID=A0A4U7JB34_9FIRM|nr:methyl-accepting chemotaxis protein [Ruminiclostridium herbifermentans]QNU66864.1 hypothetical protein EHE19_018885 [Ruminiclostridium herbifermentans]